MSARPVLLALLAAGLAAGYAVAATLASGEAGGGPEGARAEMVGVFAWREDWEGFGGFSGLALSPDGLSFTALSDRALLVTGRLGRDAAGAVTAVEVEGRARLLDTEGGPLRGLRADSEDVAVAPDGTVFITFEGSARVRLWELVRAALVAPKRRVATGPTRGSVERRLEGKRRRAGVKAGRGAGALDP